MRVCVTSDLHGFLPAVPPCDLLVVAGDVCPADDHDVARQAAWLDTAFRAWLAAAPAGRVVGVAGNHDFVFERAAGLVPKDLPWTYLQDAGCEVGGLRVWGSPVQPVFFDWAFNRTPEAIARHWELVPPDTAVLVTHGPPHGVGDGVVGRGGVGNAGCPLLARTLDRLPGLRLHAFGHIHEGYGVYRRGAATLVNGAHVDGRYRPVNPPVVVDL